MQRVEDEWREFEEEERKDYTGLKIGQLQISDDDQLNDDGEVNDKYDSDGELMTIDGERQRNGPWNKGAEEAAAAEAAAGPVKTAAHAVQERHQAAAGNSVYISPALRNAPVSDFYRPKKCVLNLINATPLDVNGATSSERCPARYSQSRILPCARFGQTGGGEEEASRTGFRRGQTWQPSATCK